MAQTEIDNRIILSGSSGAEKQVLNIGDPANSESAIRPEDVKYGNFNYAAVTASGQDTLLLTFQEPVYRLYNGDLFFFTMPYSNTGPLMLSVDGMDTLFPLMINKTDSVGRGRLLNGQIVGAIYLNNNAYIISKTEKTCPAGFTKVNDNYCVETYERSAANYFFAVSDCIDENFELCNLGEWYYACVNRTALGIFNMINNYEWLDDASNDVLQVRVIGSSGCGTVGNADAGVGNLNYRCCYILK